jgi:hypothetical protein
MKDHPQPERRSENYGCNRLGQEATDRSTILLYMAHLLRRMDELSYFNANDQAEIDGTIKEVGAIRERWDACMRAVNPNHKPIDR